MDLSRAYDVMTVARRLVLIGAPADATGEADAVFVSPLHLQKLLYYVQGWGLALLGRPLFRQRLEAWKFGPVVPEVYDRFRGRSDAVGPGEIAPTGEEIDPTASALIDTVWREYVGVPSRELIERTHREPAWLEARAGLADDAPSGAALSLDTMRTFFKAEAVRLVKPRGPFPAIDPADVWAAEEASEASGRKTVPAADVFAALLEGP